MRRVVAIFLAVVLLFLARDEVYAQEYSITDFSVQATINQDTSITVIEKISANFEIQKHGIYRDIPSVYDTPKGKLNIRLHVLSVTDELGAGVKYSVSQAGGTTRIKIGDAKKYVTGPNSYVIKYKAQNIIQRFDEHDEFYWNVVGDKWDVTIRKPQIKIESPNAVINNIACYTGRVGSTEGDCLESFGKNHATVASYQDIYPGSDFTVVVGLDKNNSLIFPTQAQQTASYIQDNIVIFLLYVFAISPLVVFGFFWYKFGRDQRYVSENIYYAEDNDRVEPKPLLAREHLPLAYMRVGDLTPAEAGTLIDERVDLSDIIAEIMELARLGYIRISRQDKKQLIGTKKDFLLKDLKKDTTPLADYQKFLCEKLFSESKTEDEVKLSELKNKFYKHLPELRKKLYQEVTNKALFVDNPEKVKQKWGLVYALFFVPLLLIPIVGNVIGESDVIRVVVILTFSLLTSGVFLLYMPRRTAKGYGLYRQLKGLQDYLKRGKWRHEISEKHLFLEEMLPVAISLGVVKELSRDMKDLGVEPPSYVSGVATANLGSFAGDFQKTAASALSGGSSKSGGSGFSGGSGGGFGGGGGGSW